MYISFNLFSKLLASRQLQNITVNSYMPTNSLYPQPFMCESFNDSFMQLNPSDNVTFYSYGSQAYSQFLNQEKVSFNDYVLALNQFKDLINSYNLNISFRSNEELYSEYIKTMSFVPMGSMVSIIDSNYETVSLNFKNLKFPIPTVHIVKLSMPDFIKMIRLFMPQIVLTVKTAKKLYESYTSICNFKEDVAVGSNGLSNFKTLQDLCNTIDMIISNIFQRDIPRSEISKVIGYGVITQEYVNFYNFMLQRYGIPEAVSKQTLYLGRGARNEQFELIKEAFGIKHIDPNRPVVLMDTDDKNKIKVERNVFESLTDNGILSAF